jgi:hypothetical protein
VIPEVRFPEVMPEFVNEIEIESAKAGTAKQLNNTAQTKRRNFMVLISWRYLDLRFGFGISLDQFGVHELGVPPSLPGRD